MSHATSVRYLPHLLPAGALLPSWQQVAAGALLLPAPLYMATILTLPVFEFNVLLLDSAASMPTPLLAGGVTVVIAVVGWLLNRTISGFDTSTQETKQAVNALTALVTEMRLERKDDRQLTAYLKERQDKLEEENRSLRSSVNAFDRHIAVAAARKSNDND
ncbi:hypothetical protein [Hymenobacter psychrophilus]|uniref:Uncharacterized protein n=1 Tax=Hymenobacter psychrophilus TaxID=651662 RepID=A0A1H3PIE7_9BACT|nr:hypothetical protein [Hymenobacter psychrophilus]SDZ00733.1 hypothetical protein SAMN04488069_1335 [Hymenobacter psychrophilus]